MYLLPVGQWAQTDGVNDWSYYKGLRVKTLLDILQTLPENFVITTNHVGNLAIMAEDGVTQRGYIDLSDEVVRMNE